MTGDMWLALFMLVLFGYVGYVLVRNLIRGGHQCSCDLPECGGGCPHKVIK